MLKTAVLISILLGPMAAAAISEPVLPVESAPAPTIVPERTPISSIPMPSPIDALARTRWGLTAAVGFPHVVNVGAQAMHPSKMFGGEANVGTYGIGLPGVSARLTNYEISGRYHPWASGFHFGAKLGHRVLTVGKTKSIFTSPVTAEATVRSNYVLPNVGWLWMGENGFTIGFDVGWLFPFAVSSELESNVGQAALGTDDWDNLSATVGDAGQWLGERSLPTMSLLKVGWIF